MTPLHIREAEEGDADSISSLMSELGYELSPPEMKERIETYRGSSDTVLVADEGGAVVGFVSFHAIPLFHTPGKLGRITAMGIDSNRQRQGIGRALLEKLDDFARQSGCARIEVSSGDRRAHDAHLFYQACGFVLDSRRFQKMLH